MLVKVATTWKLSTSTTESEPWKKESACAGFGQPELLTFDGKAERFCSLGAGGSKEEERCNGSNHLKRGSS